MSVVIHPSEKAGPFLCEALACAGRAGEPSYHSNYRKPRRTFGGGCRKTDHETCGYPLHRCPTALCHAEPLAEETAYEVRVLQVNRIWIDRLFR